MGDLTETDMELIKKAFKDVLSDKDLLPAMLEPFVTRIVIVEMTEKFEKTLGIDCTKQDQRNKLKKNLDVLEEFVAYSESERGKMEIAALKKVAHGMDSIASAVVKLVFYFLLVGLVIMVSAGASGNSPSVIFKRLFG